MVKNRFSARPYPHGIKFIYDQLSEVHLVCERGREYSFGDLFALGFLLGLLLCLLFDLFCFGRFGECPHGKDYKYKSN